MRSLLRTLLLMFVTFAGTALLVNPFSAGLEETGIRMGLAATRPPLTELANLLHEYKRVHGAYPSNDQGLAALDTFDARFRLTVPADPPGDGKQAGFPATLKRGYSRGAMEVYREAHGGPPRDARQFRESRCWRPRTEEKPGTQFVEVEIGITRDDWVFVLGPAGACSPWQLPCIYENRNGLDQAKFKFSPVNGDTKQQFSVRVDDGVYIYSAGALLRAERLKAIWWRNFILAFPGAGLLAVGVVLFRRMLRIERSKAGTWLAMVMSVVLGAMAGQGTSVSSCYVGFPGVNRDLTPEMGVRQQQLLDQYRAAGVITAETYAKAVASLDPAKIGRRIPGATTAPDAKR